MGLITQAIGIGMVLLALIDIYLTVLYPRSGHSVVSRPLSKGLWYIFRQVARSIPWKRWKIYPDCDRRFLSFCGPTLLVLIVTVWVCLLLSGFACLFWVTLGAGIQASDGQTPTDFTAAFYYSGYMLTTLGIGDLVPKTDLYRFLAIVEAALGFSIFTLTITYLLAVYTALSQRNIFAMNLHYQSAQTGDAIELLARHGAGGDFNQARQDISNMATNLLTLLESHHAYPVVHYFRFKENHYALARIGLIAMETATLIRSALNQEKYRSLIYSTAVAELSDGGQHLLEELSQTFLPKQKNYNGQQESVLQQRFYQAVKRLNAEGIETVDDLQSGAALYISLRRQWEPYVMALADYMAYHWHDIAQAEYYLSLKTRQQKISSKSNQY
jgi:hypothetical protein